jgi:hypothetical protein
MDKHDIKTVLLILAVAIVLAVVLIPFIGEEINQREEIKKEVRRSILQSTQDYQAHSFKQGDKVSKDWSSRIISEEDYILTKTDIDINEGKTPFDIHLLKMEYAGEFSLFVDRAYQAIYRVDRKASQKEGYKVYERRTLTEKDLDMLRIECYNCIWNRY